jgi:hypothetical protein
VTLGRHLGGNSSELGGSRRHGGCGWRSADLGCGLPVGGRETA